GSASAFIPCSTPFPKTISFVYRYSDIAWIYSRVLNGSPCRPLLLYFSPRASTADTRTGKAINKLMINPERNIAFTFILISSLWPSAHRPLTLTT
ncbi:MAG: hypothetical protein KGS72_29255, partial [Cyanobacteria bacterium REEB67]|nr:hypothetical protein [Cyanobacteria bacterium REEB67]